MEWKPSSNNLAVNSFTVSHCHLCEWLEYLPKLDWEKIKTIQSIECKLLLPIAVMKDTVLHIIFLWNEDKIHCMQSTSWLTVTDYWKNKFVE
jgi:hypothetical protein